MLNLGIIPKELSIAEISPVDLTALAIVKLFDQKNLSNGTYHVFNPNNANLQKLLTQHKNTNILKVPFEEFIETILKHLDLNQQNEQIELFMLHQGWLQDVDLSKVTKFEILQDKTEAILAKLNFKWQPITSEMFSDIIINTFKRKTPMTEQEIMTKHLNYITKMVPSVVFWLDHDFKFLGINQVAVDANGAPNIECFLGKTVQEVYPLQVSEQLMADFNEVSVTEKEIQREYVLEDMSTGRPKYFMANVAPLYDLSGNEKLGIIVSAIDITEKKESEKLTERQRILNYLQSIAETVPCLFYWMDLNGRYVGVNELCVSGINAPSKEYIIGKNVYELYQDKEIADKLLENIDEVFQTGNVLHLEDKIIDISTRKVKYYTATRSPLRDSNGEIIGLVGASIDITAQKEAEMLSEQQRIFNYLESIADKIPCAVYWLDINYVLSGVNQKLLNSIGATSRDEVVGKTVYEFYPEHIANSLQNDFKEAMTTGQDIEREHVIQDITTGKPRYFAATVSPIRDVSKNIIGVIGTSIEITDTKEKAQLEIQAHKAAAEEDEKFKTVVRRLVHDINAPISSINNMVSRLSKVIPENERVTLRNASERIAGISQRLLKQYDKQEDEEGNEVFLASLALMQVINERREDHRDTGVTFELIIDDEDDESAHFTFIEHNVGVFKRMISNIVKNAVEAMKGKADGKVQIRLAAVAKKIVIIIRDNGYGMPEHIQEKFKQGIEVTEGKEGGNGIGLQQVRAAIQAGGGTYDVYATENGTKITMRFPIVDVPRWIATEIKLTKDDIVIILDDDNSIHGSWDSNFKEALEENPTLKVKHFFNGREAVAYINSLTPEQKQDVFLLTDFELLDQDINGLDVVQQTQMTRAILVTSYSGQNTMQKNVVELGIKMLPKEFAANAKILVDKKIPKWSNKADMVWVEDQRELVDGIVEKYYNHLKVDVYYDPVKFMENVHQYPLDTRIILDTYYDAEDGTPYLKTGYALAKELHALGYTKLIIYTGEDPGKRAPEYLQVVRKKDPDGDKNMDKI